MEYRPTPRATITTLALAACLTLILQGPASASDQPLRLQGLFCNSEEQIDRTLAHIGLGLSPHAAVELTNEAAVVCTYVDLLQYEVDNPVAIGKNFSAAPLVKYRAMLTGVLVGDNLRPVSPPVEIYFVTPDRIVGAEIERRT